VKFLSLSILSPERSDIVLPVPIVPNSKGVWFTLKEGSPYKLKFSFSVSNNIVSGLKYTNTVWKTGVKGELSACQSFHSLLGTKLFVCLVLPCFYHTRLFFFLAIFKCLICITKSRKQCNS